MNLTTMRALRILRSRLLLAALCACTVGQLVGSPVQAFAPRILLVSSPGVSGSVERAAGSALAEVGQLVAADEYEDAASRARLSPSSTQALSSIAPNMHVRMIVLLSVEHGSLYVSYRDGRSGSVLGSVSVRLSHGRLSRGSQAQIAEGAQQALAATEGSGASYGSGPANPPAQPAFPQYQGYGEAPGPAYGEPAPPAYQEPAPPGYQEPPPGYQEPPPGYQEPEAPGYQEEPPPPSAAEANDNGGTGPQPTAAAESSFRSVIGAGAGVGGRNVRMPSRAGEHRLDTGLFPAVAVHLALEGRLGAHALLTAAAQYHTSLGLQASQESLDGGPPKQTTLRSHHVDVGLTPSYRFTESPDAVRLGVFIGWAFRGLRPVVELSVPAYSLSGLILRPELVIPIAGGSVTLRIAPELFAVAYVTGGVRNVSNSKSSGLGFGGQAALEVRLSDSLGAAFTYRESHASVASPWPTALTDVERFATLSLSFMY